MAAVVFDYNMGGFPLLENVLGKVQKMSSETRCKVHNSLAELGG